MSATAARGSGGRRRVPPALAAGAAILAGLALLAVLAPLLAPDPNVIDVPSRLRPPSASAWFGTDAFGRDIFGRTVWGGRVSLTVGVAVAATAVLSGLAIGGLCGFVRQADAIVMRIMDGLMAVPSVLLAIAIVLPFGRSLAVLVLAIAVPEAPAMTRLVRGIVLSARTRLWVDAAVVCGAPPGRLVRWHMLPSALPVVLVQATYVCSSAILTEAILGFLGAGLPPDVPSWGAIIAQGRQQLQVAPWVVFFPGLFITLAVLAVNVCGDALGDQLDPSRDRDG